MRYLPTAKGFHARHSHFFLTLNSYFLVLITIFAYPSTLNLYYMQHLDEYINEIGNLYATGMAREHSYRPALEKLLNALLPGLKAINEPARIACGAPDYIIIRESDSQPVAFVEAKDIGDNDLDGRKQHREQFNRYKSSLNHIVFTDYLDFHLYEYGEPTACVRIAETTGDKIVAVKGNEAKFAALINRLAEAQMQSITSAGRLAVQMAAKARLLAETIKAALGDTDENKGLTVIQQLAHKAGYEHDLEDLTVQQLGALLSDYVSVLNRTVGDLGKSSASASSSTVSTGTR